LRGGRGITRNAALRLLVSGLFASLQMIHANAFLDVNGVFTTITLPGSPGGINNSGQIVGSGPSEGFLYTNGALSAIDVPGSGYTYAFGINDLGQIVGAYGVSSLVEEGFLYSNGIFSTIDVPGSEDFTEATAINDSSQIVGIYTGLVGPNALTLGFLDVNGMFTTLYYPGSAGQFSLATEPSGINNAGEIVGTVYIIPAGFPGGAVPGYAFVYDNGVFSLMSVPGSLDTVANGINDSGQIVGYYIDGNDVQHGFLDTNGIFQTIDFPNALPGTTDLVGINDAGEIVGTFEPAPEPASSLFVVCGLAGIALLKRYRRSHRRGRPT
jgi:probable HAF family extracellular repeat protein